MRIHSLYTISALTVFALTACGAPGTEGVDGAADAEDLATVASMAPQDAFWANLQMLCESSAPAAPGKLLQAPEGDTQIDPEAPLVVHFWECGDDELRFPLHVADNRSRTWVFTRHDDHLELRHDHRHEDGTEESNTWYGATTLEEGSPTMQEFVTRRGEFSGGWRVEIKPGERFTYGTIANGEWRHHLEFDLSTPTEVPPLPWGHETRPSQKPEI